MEENNQLKLTIRDENSKNKLKTRLKTIEGQVRGISNMLDEDRYCHDILIQISAINKSLKSLGEEILKKHLESCVVKEIKNDNLTIINEVMELIKRLD